jgi:hypothetical protein
MTARTATGTSDVYAARRAELLARIAEEKRRGARLGALRLGAFGGLTVTGWIALRSSSPFGGGWGAMALAGLVAFAIGVVLSRRSRARLQWSQDRLTIAEEGLARVRRDWNAIPLRAWDAPDGTHPYAGDLDLFGSGSLSQLLPPLSRAPGRGTLASWLLAPAERAVIAERQEAVRELVPRGDLLEEMAVQGLYMTIEPDRLEGLQAWAASAPATRWTPRRAQLAAGLLGATTWALFVADLANLSEGPLWGLSALVAVVASGFATRRLRVASAHAYGHLTTLRALGSIISRVQGEAFRAAMLQRAQRDLTEGQLAALSSFARLARLVEYSEVRRSPLPHFVLNALVLWDVHVLAGFNRWQATRGGDVGRWLAAIGTVEALAALATLANDNPDWVFPELTEESDRIVVRALGHPLLPPDRCVRNDVELGPRGTLLVISGSNMSGKSTLLRTVGINAVLAFAGAPVRAERLRISPLAIGATLRVQDSLQKGTSRFYAEIQRIRDVVE